MRTIKYIYSVISWIFVLVLWACAASVYLRPAEWNKYISVFSLTFPFWAGATCILFLLGLVFRSKSCLVPLLGIVCAAGSVRDYFPVNLSSPAPKGCLKVMTYNTQLWGAYFKDEDGELSVPRYICSQQPDVACLQEVDYSKVSDTLSVYRTMHRYGYNYKSAKAGYGTFGLATHWKILRVQVICNSFANGAVAYYVMPQRGDTLIVVNAHLQSMGLSGEERETYSQLVHNPERTSAIHGERMLIKKIADAGVVRAQQTDSLARFIDHHKGNKLIVMGDFNDTPISYAHHAVCSRLTDVFRATANGLGRSFNRDAMHVRIDHAFCSKHWKPYAAQVDATVPFSDHYPLIFYLKPTGK